MRSAVASQELRNGLDKIEAGQIVFLFKFFFQIMAVLLSATILTSSTNGIFLLKGRIHLEVALQLEIIDTLRCLLMPKTTRNFVWPPVCDRNAAIETVMLEII
jgi:hypothetical protein